LDGKQDSRNPKRLKTKNDQSGWCTYTPDLPSVDVVPVVEDFTLQPVPSGYRKEGDDWVVLYNPKVKKTLDINPAHTFVHAR